MSPTTGLERIRIGYLGKPAEHAENFARLMGAVAKTVAVLPDSLSSGVYDRSRGRWGRLLPNGLWRGGHRAVDHPFCTGDAEYVRRTVERLDEEGVNCLIAYWGTRPIGDVIAI